MKIKIVGNRDWIPNTVRDIANIFMVELVEEDDDCKCIFQVEQRGQQVTANAVFSFSNAQKLDEARERVKAELELDVINQEKRLVKKVFYLLLQKVSHKPGSPWGILTGIRPTKLVHRLLEQNFAPGEILVYLREQYLITAEKGDLLLQTALNQRKLLLSSEEAQKKVGIYIGIPFCPSRCLYCSFPAYRLTAENQELKEKFLFSLQAEIKAISQHLTAYGLAVTHIYLGGGTPTSLTAAEMDQLLTLINFNLRGINTTEVTVEAGRPDTLSQEMLTVFNEQQVTRISVNPQTLQEKTLKIIGREHTVADFWQAYFLAKEIGIPVVNVDLILGLPGETIAEVADTLGKLEKIQLDNLTIHPLALKRGSKLIEAKRTLRDKEQNALEMAELARAFAESQGLIPYYLYRQKRIFGQGENIGYSRPGLECIYNIQMIEERQTIIGLGCGAGSKWVNPQDWTLSATYHPKDLSTYLQQHQLLIARKLSLIHKLVKGGC